MAIRGCSIGVHFGLSHYLTVYKHHLSAAVLWGLLSNSAYTGSTCLRARFAPVVVFVFRRAASMFSGFSIRIHFPIRQDPCLPFDTHLPSSERTASLMLRQVSGCR